MDAEIWTGELGRPGSTRELGPVRLSAVRCPATESPGGGTGAPGGHRYHLTLLPGGVPAPDQEHGSAPGRSR
jgi:hypothetical protein